jgi:hypothetical protein
VPETRTRPPRRPTTGGPARRRGWTIEGARKLLGLRDEKPMSPQELVALRKAAMRSERYGEMPQAVYAPLLGITVKTLRRMEYGERRISLALAFRARELARRFEEVGE